MSTAAMPSPDGTSGCSRVGQSVASATVSAASSSVSARYGFAGQRRQPLFGADSQSALQNGNLQPPDSGCRRAGAVKQPVGRAYLWLWG